MVSNSQHRSNVLFQKGIKALTRGKNAKALHYFSEARDSSADPLGSIELRQLYGIAYRKLGEQSRGLTKLAYLQAADGVFHSAHQSARGDDQLRGRILRDWGMVSLARGEINKALKQFERSCALLAKAPIEHAASRGFVGRALYKQGSIAKAKLAIRQANDVLHGKHNVYELNNLTWLLKAESSREARRKLGIRACWLAFRTKNVKRMIQILLLVVYRPLGLRFEKY